MTLTRRAWRTWGSVGQAKPMVRTGEDARISVVVEGVDDPLGGAVPSQRSHRAIAGPLDPASAAG
jgi:hypothetical protein